MKILANMYKFENILKKGSLMRVTIAWMKQLQSFAKDIWNLLGFRENLDSKYKFNVAFWLY